MTFGRNLITQAFSLELAKDDLDGIGFDVSDVCDGYYNEFAVIAKNRDDGQLVFVKRIKDPLAVGNEQLFLSAIGDLAPAQIDIGLDTRYVCLEVISGTDLRNEEALADSDLAILGQNIRVMHDRVREYFSVPSSWPSEVSSLRKPRSVTSYLDDRIARASFTTSGYQELLLSESEHLKEFIDEQGVVQRIHGDVTHGNVLRSGGGFKFIDPKTMYGHPVADLAIYASFCDDPESVFSALMDGYGISSNSQGELRFMLKAMLLRALILLPVDVSEKRQPILDAAISMIGSAVVEAEQVHLSETLAKFSAGTGDSLNV